jgi:hypothetical protein
MVFILLKKNIRKITFSFEMTNGINIFRTLNDLIQDLPLLVITS